MKKNHYLWIALVLMATLTLPGLLERHKVETSQNIYETVMPFSEIEKLSDDLDQTVDSLLLTLKEHGLETISISPLNLNELERQGITTSFSYRQLKDFLVLQPGLTEELNDESRLGRDYYFTRPESAYYQSLIEEALDPDVIKVGDTTLYHVIDLDEPYIIDDQPVTMSILDRYLGYDETTIELMNNLDLRYLLRVENSYPDQERIIDDLLALKSTSLNGLLFSGEELIGFPNNYLMKEFSQTLTNSGYHFYSIEFTNQRGLTTYGETSDYNFVRLHSLELDDQDLDSSLQRSIRAVKERNIRSLFIRLPDITDPEAQLTTVTNYLTNLSDDLPDQFMSGGVVPFEQIDDITYATVASIIGSVLLTYIALTFIPISWLKYAGAIGTLFVGILLLVTGLPLLNQTLALFISLIGAIYATLIATEGAKSLKTITITYLKSILVTTLTVIFIIQLLNGNAYINGILQFRGVSLVYTVPIIAIAVWAFRDVFIYSVNYLKSINIDRLKQMGRYIVNLNVKYWHIILVAIIGLGFNYYLSRGGNSGSVTDLEIWFRNQLELLLYVRPRTKEFLIGLPIFVFSIYLTATHPKIGRFFFIIGSIGFLSIINTFSHLHTPIYISLLRTFYSLVIGFVLGLLLIKLWQWIESKGKKFWR